MDNTFQKNFIADFEVDNASYQDVMDEELVDNLEHSVMSEENMTVTDDVLRALLKRFQKKNFKPGSAVDTFEDEVMDVVVDASIKND